MLTEGCLTEEWRPVEGWPDYEVSNLGRIKRVTRYRSKAGAIRKNILLKSTGYLAITLTHRSGARKMLLVHRLVAKAFLPPPSSPDMEVNHKDTDRTNPRADNLEWVTRSENRQHGYDVGFCDAVGEANGYSKLTNAAVLEIRRLAKADQSNWAALAARFGVSKATIRDVVTGRTWTHLLRAAA